MYMWLHYTCTVTNVIVISQSQDLYGNEERKIGKKTSQYTTNYTVLLNIFGVGNGCKVLNKSCEGWAGKKSTTFLYY